MGVDRYKRRTVHRDDRDDKRTGKKKSRRRRRDDENSDYSDFCEDDYPSDDDKLTRKHRRRKTKERTPRPVARVILNECPLCEDVGPVLWQRGYVLEGKDREPDYPRLDDPGHINYQGPQLPDAFSAHYQPGQYCFGTAFVEAGYVKPVVPESVKEETSRTEERALKRRRDKRRAREKEKRDRPAKERKQRARDYRTFRHRHDKYDDDSASDAAGSDSDSEEDAPSSSEDESVTSEGRAIQRRRRRKKKEKKGNRRDERRRARRDEFVEIDTKRFRRHAKPFVVRARECEEERVLEAYGASCVCSRRWGEEWAPRAGDRGLHAFEQSMAKCMKERGL